MSRPARGLSVVVSLAAALAVAGPALAGDVATPRVAAQLGPYVRAQVQRAAERLGQAGCAQVLSDYSDAETGRPLDEALRASLLDASTYLGSLEYRPGEAAGPCRDASVAAHTSPGSRVVYVCSKFLRWQKSRDQSLPVAILIHEALHTLGLGENPPSTFEITAHVVERCGL